MFLKLLGNYKDLGLLFTRVGVGIMFAYAHGYAKFFGGPELWERIGKAMRHVGVDLFPVVWGFLAGFSEFIGGILLAIGLFTRPATLLLLITMFVASAYHLGSGDTLSQASHAIKTGFFFLGLLFLGPGKYSLDHLLKKA